LGPIWFRRVLAQCCRGLSGLSEHQRLARRVEATRSSILLTSPPSRSNAALGRSRSAGRRYKLPFGETGSIA
jgi:hypothetical protein